MQVPQNQLKIGIILNYINMGLGSLVPIFYTPIMLHLLGQEEYGLYKLSSVATSYLNLISMGLGAAVTRYLIKAKTEQGQDAEENIFGLFLIIFRVVALLTFIAGVVLIFFLDNWYGDSLTEDNLHKMQLLVFIMVCNMAFSFSVSPYMSIVTAREKYFFYQLMGILGTVVIPIVNIIVLYLGYASIGLSMASLIMAILIRVAYFLYVKESLHIHPRYKGVPFSFLKEIAVFSFWIFVANLVSQLFAATDTMMIGAIPALAVVGVAIYNIGGVLEGMIGNITTGISSLLSPRVNIMVFSGTSNEELTNYSIRIGRIQCYIVSILLSVFAIFGKPFIHFYLGDEYIGAYGITLLIGIPKIIVLSQSVFLNILIAKNMNRFRSLVYLVIALINVIGTWFALRIWGIEGAAAVTGVSFLLGHGLIMNWFYWQKVGLDIPRFWIEIMKVLMAPLFLTFIAIWFLQEINLYDIWNLLTCMFLFVSILLGVQWIVAFNDYEKDLLFAFLRKLKLSNNTVK